jgi:hypothetical protein
MSSGCVGLVISDYTQPRKRATKTEGLEMSKKTHTPGPWNASDRCPRAHSANIYADGVWVAGAMGDHDIEGSGPADGFPTNDQCEANARLIAAAPDLLDVALDVVDLLEEMGLNTSELAHRAEDAIVKAVGS